MLREGGAVERAHTLPHHGSYSVGKHSFDAVNLLLVLHPNPSMNLVKAILWHDVAERYTGDIPATAKWSDGELAKRLQLLEQRIERVLGIDIHLTPEERCWLKAVDRIELLLWAKDQLAMGNQNAMALVGNLAVWFGTNEIPKECVDFVSQHNWSRTPDEIPKETT